jgi:hypothetical protein
MQLRTPAKNGLLAVLLLCCATLIAVSQDQRTPAPNSAPPADSKSVTIKGCLTGFDGHYTIGTSRDDLYVLQGDASLFKRYNGKMVKATGTLSASVQESSTQNALSQQPPQFKVSQLRKIADICGN